MDNATVSVAYSRQGVKTSFAFSILDETENVENPVTARGVGRK